MKKIHKVLKPTYIYIVVLVAYYFLREVKYVPFGVWLSFFIIIVPPILLFFWNLKRIKEYYKTISHSLLFGLSGIPGFLLGIQVFYGFTTTLSGEYTLETILIMLVFGLLSGLAFGLVGLLMSYIMKRFAG